MNPTLVSAFLLSSFALRPASAQCGQWDTEPGAVGIGSGPGATVLCSVRHDDGSGPAQYVGGSFTSAGGSAANNLARWDGAGWSALGAGTNAAVRAMAVYDFGLGPQLIIGGDFSTVDNVPAFRFARWDGAQWHDLGGQLNSTASIRSLVVAPLGLGGQPVLFVGGLYFVPAGGSGANHYGIVGWNGSGWSPVGGAGAPGGVLAMDTWDSNGPAAGGLELFVTGNFTAISGVSALRVARWDGTGWQAAGAGLSHAGSAVAGVDGGAASGLYVGGLVHSSGTTQVNNLARWDGASWQPVGGGANDGVNALAAHDDGRGLALFAGGRFNAVGGLAARRVARWDGAAWSAVGSGIDLVNGNEAVSSLCSSSDPLGGVLVAGGNWSRIDLLPTNNIALWRGNSSGASYCTAKVTSGGCVPRITASGAPSLASPSTFAITATSLRPQVSGLLFFSLSGPQAAPFQGGFLCVRQPTYRLPNQLTGGAASCSGTLGTTLAALLGHSAGGPQISAGSRIELQAWFRDPQSPSTTGLSGGLDVYVCP